MSKGDSDAEDEVKDHQIKKIWTDWIHVFKYFWQHKIIPEDVLMLFWCIPEIKKKLNCINVIIPSRQNNEWQIKYQYTKGYDFVEE